MRARTTPTGTSSGTSTLATTSAMSTQAPPRTALRALRALCPDPTSLRAMSGTASPTKPSGPQIAVAAPASAPTATSPQVRTTRTRTPSPAAASSPRARTPSAGPRSAAMTAPIAKGAHAHASEERRTPSREPDTQWRNSLKANWSARTTACVSEDRAAVRAMPASARRAREPGPPRPASRWTAQEAASAPARAAVALRACVETPVAAQALTTPRAAPALTPRIPGSARGLRVSACMTAPARPSAHPTTRPAMVRGTRIRTTTSVSIGVPVPVSACQTWAGESTREPMAREAAMARNSTRAQTPNTGAPRSNGGRCPDRAPDGPALRRSAGPLRSAVPRTPNSHFRKVDSMSDTIVSMRM